MRKLKHCDKKVTVFTVESVENFFHRGKKTAQDIDQKRELTARRVIGFEDPVDFMKFLTRSK